MRLPIKILLFPLALALLLAACHDPDDDKVVAKVYGHKLYRSDLEGLMSHGMSQADSVAIVQNYINQWVDEMVLVSKAEKNIKEDFSQQLQHYRNSLLVYAYEQQIVEQMIDTVVSADEIREYYQEHKQDFVLRSPIVKSLYVKMNPDDVQFWRMATLLEQYEISEADYLEIQRIISRSVIEYSYDNESWIPLTQLRSKISDNIFSDPNYLRRVRFSLLRDSSGVSMVHFFDVKLANETSPMEVEYKNIKSVIINLRKVALINKMRQDLRRKAEEDGAVFVI